MHGHPNFEFLKAVDKFQFDATGFTVLEMGAPAISEKDFGRPLLLLDSTWFLLPRIRAKIFGSFARRSIPPSVKTAYPRVSKMHSDPDGLATVEALYAALRAMGDADRSLLSGYYFAEKFLEINGWFSDANRA